MGKEVLLYYPQVNFGVDPNAGHRMPYSLVQLIRPLINHGFNVTISDGRFGEQPVFVNHLVNLPEKPIYVGFTSMTGQQLIDAMEMSKKVREIDKTIPIVWGGWHPSLLPRETVMEPFVDIVAVGQGETTCYEIAQCLQAKDDLRKVDGIVFKENGNPVFTKCREFTSEFYRLPLDLFDLRKYAPNLAYFTSFGCPFACTFCAITQVYKNRKVYYRKMDEIIEDLKYIFDHYPGVFQQLHMDDDNFCVKKARVAEFCDRYDNYGGVRILIEGHVRALIGYPDDIWEKMKKAGIAHILIGAESGNQTILDRLKKNQRPEHILKLVEKCKQWGITPELSCMTGFPDSDELEDFKDTIEMLQKAGTIFPGTMYKMFYVRPYPGTALYDYFKSLGWKLPKNMKEWSEYTLRFKPPWITQELEEMVSFYTYRYQPTVGWNYDWNRFRKDFLHARANQLIPRPPIV